MRVHERRCGSTNSCGERRTDIIFFSPMGRHYSNSSWPSLTGNPFLMIVWCVVSLCVVVWVGVGGVFFAQMSAPSQAQGAADQDVIDVTHTRAHCPTTNNNRATHATTTSPQHFHHSAAAAAAASVAEDPLSLSPLPFLSKDAVQSHNYIFTVNNPRLTEDEFAKRMIKEHFPGCAGLVFQLERGANGTLHYQGVLRLKSKLRTQGVKNKFRSADIKGWVESCVDLDAAVLYVTKDDTRVKGPWTYGNIPTVDDIEARKKTKKKHGGKRTDLDAVAEDVMAGKNMVQVATAHPTSFIKYSKGITALADLLQKKERNWMTELYIFWGPTNTGKSWRAEQMAKGTTTFHMAVAGQKSATAWWDMYNGQETVIINDFYGEIPLSQMLNIIDRYPFQVQVKGSFRVFLAKRVIITSNSYWKDWYEEEFKKRPQHVDAFARRITKCENMTVQYRGNELYDEEEEQPRQEEDDEVVEILSRGGAQPSGTQPRVKVEGPDSPLTLYYSAMEEEARKIRQPGQAEPLTVLASLTKSCK